MCVFAACASLMLLRLWKSSKCTIEIVFLLPGRCFFVFFFVFFFCVFFCFLFAVLFFWRRGRAGVVVSKASLRGLIPASFGSEPPRRVPACVAPQWRIFDLCKVCGRLCRI